VFLLLGLGAYFGYTRGNLAGGQQAKGRWVYDRGLGGKKVGALTQPPVLSAVLQWLEEQLPADSTSLGVCWHCVVAALHCTKASCTCIV